MKKVFNRCLGLWVVIFVFLSLTGCGPWHVTKMQISDALDHDALYKSFDVHPTDLSLSSQCNAPPSVKIINIESRIEDYEFQKNPMIQGLINPKELMDGVSLYLKDGFAASNIKVDDQSTKVLQLKMIDLTFSDAGYFRWKSYFKMELIIPEKNFSKFYDAWEYSGYKNGNGFRAEANAIHVVTRQIIDDPVIQDYILCK